MIPSLPNSNFYKSDSPHNLPPLVLSHALRPSSPAIPIPLCFSLFFSQSPMASSICSSFSAPLSSSRALQRTVLSSPPSHSHSNCHLNFHFRTQKALRVSTPRPPLSLKVLCTREFRAPAVTKDSWEKSILKSEIPVLVEFYASWCGPCRMVNRVIDDISRDYAGRLKFFVLNTDNDLQVAEDYEIKAVPVVLLFKNGEKRESVVGTMPKDFYVSAIERVLKS